MVGKLPFDDSNDNKKQDTVDAIIVGSGLAGLTVALTILDHGGRLILVEKMGPIGRLFMSGGFGFWLTPKPLSCFRPHTSSSQATKPTTTQNAKPDTANLTQSMSDLTILRDEIHNKDNTVFFSSSSFVLLALRRGRSTKRLLVCS